MPSFRSSTLLLVLALALLGCSALAAALPTGSQRALAADETGGETTTTPEELPPVVETPTEPETTTPEPEAPVTPPVTTPPLVAPTGESGGAPAETPKSTPPSGSETGGGGAGGSGGGGSSPGSPGAPATAAAPASPAAAPTRSTSRAQARQPNHDRKVGAGTVGTGGSAGEEGGNGSRDGSRGAPAPSHSGGGAPAPQPTVSTPAFDERASAVGDVASHVGAAFAEALPTAPLKRIGDQVAAHIAGVDSTAGGAERERAADRLGTALGAALLGSAVAIDRTPAGNGPLLPFDAPGGKSGAIFLVLIAALLLLVGVLILREVRSSLGFGASRGTVWAAGERPWADAKMRATGASAAARKAGYRWLHRLRRFRASAAAGLRSLF